MGVLDVLRRFQGPPGYPGSPSYPDEVTGKDEQNQSGYPGYPGYPGFIRMTDEERETAIAEWLTANPDHDPGMCICVHCGKPDAPLAVLSGDGGHRWLHQKCLPDWRLNRRVKAEMAVPYYRAKEES